jgi:uncharacterized protein
LALYYLETSALVKLYVYEVGTERLLTLADDTLGNRLAILSLAQVEFRAAIRRRQRSGGISAVDANEIVEAFRQHSEGRFLVQTFSESLTDVACALLDAYQLRAYDSMQLAGYLTLRSICGVEEPIFVCADRALLAAAQNEGCRVFDPTTG